MYINGDDELLPWSLRTPVAHRRTTEPLILYATHGSWWDAALAIVLAMRVHDLDIYGMMEYKQLVRYKFFRRIGMFSVVREDPRSALRSIRYATDMVSGSGKSIWMFPQGELIQQDVRPLGFEPGLSILAKKLGTAWFCPVAFRYEMVREQRPDCLIRVGTPERLVWSPETRAEDATSDFEKRLTALADQVRSDAMTGELSSYRRLYSGRMSMEKRFDKVKGNPSGS